MDALAGYGSDSDSSQNVEKPAGALAGLLGSYSDDDSHQSGESAAAEPAAKRSKINKDAEVDVPEETFAGILPPPKLVDISSDNFQSTKDYTIELREKLAQQLKSQEKQPQSEKHEQLTKKLDQMHLTFQSVKEGNVENKSFAAHLKSQHQFHNPHLLKDIISHFEISPLTSNVGNKFSGFEYVDRLMGAEERSRNVNAAGLLGYEN